MAEETLRIFSCFELRCNIQVEYPVDNLHGRALMATAGPGFPPEYFSVPEMEYSIGPLDDARIMGGKEERRAFLPIDGGKEVNEGQAGLRVEACRRLIGGSQQPCRKQ